MTTAAKRARKKANKAKGRPDELADFVEVGPPEITPPVNEEPVTTTTESEHAAAMLALARAKRMRNRKVVD